MAPRYFMRVDQTSVLLRWGNPLRWNFDYADNLWPCSWAACPRDKSGIPIFPLCQDRWPVSWVVNIILRGRKEKTKCHTTQQNLKNRLCAKWCPPMPCRLPSWVEETGITFGHRFWQHRIPFRRLISGLLAFISNNTYLTDHCLLFPYRSRPTLLMKAA